MPRSPRLLGRVVRPVGARGGHRPDGLREGLGRRAPRGCCLQPTAARAAGDGQHRRRGHRDIRSSPLGAQVEGRRARSVRSRPRRDRRRRRGDRDLGRLRSAGHTSSTPGPASHPAPLLASATVVGPDLGLADALATGLSVAGQHGLAAIDALGGYEAMVIGAAGAIESTGGVSRKHRRLNRSANPAPSQLVRARMATVRWLPPCHLAAFPAAMPNSVRRRHLSPCSPAWRSDRPGRLRRIPASRARRRRSASAIRSR